MWADTAGILASVTAADYGLTRLDLAAMRPPPMTTAEREASVERMYADARRQAERLDTRLRRKIAVLERGCVVNAGHSVTA